MIAIPAKVSVKRILKNWWPKATVYEFDEDGKITNKRKVDYHLCINGTPKVFEFFLENDKKSDKGKSLEVPIKDIIEILKNYQLIPKGCKC